ncbi:MAG: chromosome condensation regulator RCC1, partial [Micavibrio aeruginosavorus]|nr:chromosome condensation regulator RCC1 [Micavibrio aeruginosavorus]
KTNGTLYCWGSDSSGQLGNGATTGNQVSPVQESTAATDWASVADGNLNDHTCALKTNGTLYCWGSDASGQLGNGATTGNQVSPVSIGPVWASVATGSSNTCAIATGGGALYCWGANSNGQLGGVPYGDSPVFSDVCGVINSVEYHAGSFFYNTTSNVLQYCDGAGWVRAGR